MARSDREQVALLHASRAADLLAGTTRMAPHQHASVITLGNREAGLAIIVSRTPSRPTLAVATWSQTGNALQRIEGTYRLVEPKTNRSRRTLALPEIAAAAIWAHYNRQQDAKAQAGPTWEDWGLVFTTPRGTPLNRHVVTKEFQNLLEQVGLPRQRFHDLRHTCASLLLAQNVQARDVMEVLGHSQISLTMNTYSHVMPPALRNAATRMDDILAG